MNFNGRVRATRSVTYSAGVRAVNRGNRCGGCDRRLLAHRQLPQIVAKNPKAHVVVGFPAAIRIVKRQPHRGLIAEVEHPDARCLYPLRHRSLQRPLIASEGTNPSLVICIRRSPLGLDGQRYQQSTERTLGQNATIPFVSMGGHHTMARGAHYVLG